MIQLLFETVSGNLVSFLGLLFAFVATCLVMSKCQGLLPRDQGRAYAVNGQLSAGKPRGAGFLFILVFIVASLIFCKIDRELIIYLIMTAAAMMTGFLDDCSKAPWGEYKKGLLDLIIAIMVAFTYYTFNSSDVYFFITGKTVTLHPVLFIILAVILVWVSINVTNCSDGVDGLSGTLSIITLMTVYIFDSILSVSKGFDYSILLFVICLLGYLWYNSTPSILMMGDAGSRAMGLFIAIAVLKCGSPFIYIPAAIVLILDGGLGLIKVSLLRFLKIKILTKVRTPLHDHVRKVKDWSNTQTVFRFAIIQIVVSMAVIYMCLMSV